MHAYTQIYRFLIKSSHSANALRPAIERDKNYKLPKYSWRKSWFSRVRTHCLKADVCFIENPFCFSSKTNDFVLSLSFSREKMNNAKRVQMTTKQCRCHSISLFVVKRTIFKYLYVRAKTTTKRKKLRGKSVPIGWRFGMLRHTNQFYVFFCKCRLLYAVGKTHSSKCVNEWVLKYSSHSFMAHT